MHVTCVAGVAGGMARCRNLVIEGAYCGVHDESSSRAPHPDVVLLKVNVNEQWDQRFRSAGIQKLERSPERAAKLAAEHEAQAKRLGRDAYVIREQRDGQRPEEPEAVDSGCPVFGKAGLQYVDIRGLVQEMKLDGYQLSGAHLLSRDWKPPVRLVLQFEGDGVAIAFPWDLFRGLANTCFGQVDVWANPRDRRGKVVHTVNCGRRRDDQVKSVHTLRFSGGDWKATII